MRSRSRRCEAVASSTGRRCGCRVAFANVSGQRFGRHTLLCDNHWRAINRGSPVLCSHAVLTRIDGVDKTTDRLTRVAIINVKDAAEDWRLRLAIVAALSLDLLRPAYRAKVEAGAHRLTGHCYVATEAYCHLTGAKPQFIRHEGGPHWYAIGELGLVDLTSAQFATPPDYRGQGRGKGFLTRKPSKRARVLIARVALLLDERDQQG